MVNFEIVISVCLGLFLYKIFMIILCAFLKAFFPNQWERSKKDYIN